MLYLGPITFLLAAALVCRFRAPARAVGLVDIPGGRKVHNGHVPLIGGIGTFVAFALVALFVDGSLYPYRGLFAGMAVLLVTGVLDDLRDLSAIEKFALQALSVTLLVTWGGLVVEHFGVLPGIGRFEFGLMVIPVTVLCVLGLVNSVNMLDGADGVCGGVMLSALFWLAVIGLEAAQEVAFMLPALLACAVLGFLVFNFPWRSAKSASVFMGDSGSTMLGFAAAWFAIDLAFEQGTGVPPVVVAWIFALPVFDTIALMIRRLLKGISPLASDREHLHHILERAGFSAAGTAWVFTFAAFGFGALGVGAWKLGVPEQWLWPPLLLLLVLHCMLTRHAWRAMRLLRRVRGLRPAEGAAE